MATVLYPIIVLGGMGFVLSIILIIAAQKFPVYENPLIKTIEDILPGANCGACGYAGCHSFAESIVETRNPDMFCPVGGAQVNFKIAQCLGMETSPKQAKVAVVMCEGKSDKASFVGKYKGIQDCRAAVLIHGSEKVCVYGCVGLGSCVKACKYNAITIKDGIARINPEKCIGCGACVKACPQGIIHMLPRDARVYVACSSNDLGKKVRTYCNAGCIGCKRCVKICENNAMQFRDNLAYVEYEKCTGCAKCVEVCPRNIIKNISLCNNN